MFSNVKFRTTPTTSSSSRKPTQSSSFPSPSFPSINAPTFHVRPSWNMKYMSIAKTMRYSAITAPRDVKAIRRITDHEVPSWVPIMPSGIVHVRTNEAMKGEWCYEKHIHGRTKSKLSHDEKISDIKATLRSKNVILYLHGGGFCLCNPGTHRLLMYKLAKLTHQPIFSLDYRRAPEQHHWKIVSTPIRPCYETM
jgi:acetyl esterase/lipase